jgi:hypothetical protein
MDSIQSLVDNFLREKRESKEHKSSGKFIASNLGKCYRAQFWYRKGEPITNPPDERSYRVFAVGDIFHQFVQDIITKQPNAQIEVSASNEDFACRADMVIDDEVFELKSQHSRAFWYMTKSENVAEDKEPNILQGLFCAKMLGKKKARIVFISKDDLCIQEYGFTLNEEWNKKLDKEIKTLRDYWKKDELPPACPRAYKKKKGDKIEYAECGYCGYKTKCDEIEKLKKEGK